MSSDYSTAWTKCVNESAVWGWRLW